MGTGFTGAVWRSRSILPAGMSNNAICTAHQRPVYRQLTCTRKVIGLHILVVGTKKTVRRNAITTIRSCRRAAATICLRPLHVDKIFVFIRQVAPIPACWLFKTSATSWPLTFWPWNSCPTWATSVPILVFLGISVLELGLMNATDRRHTDRQTSECQTKASLQAGWLSCCYLILLRSDDLPLHEHCAIFRRDSQAALIEPPLMHCSCGLNFSVSNLATWNISVSLRLAFSKTLTQFTSRSISICFLRMICA